MLPAAHRKPTDTTQTHADAQRQAHTNVSMQTHMHARKHMHTHTHTYTHTHIHTHTHTQSNTNANTKTHTHTPEDMPKHAKTRRTARRAPGEHAFKISRSPAPIERRVGLAAGNLAIEIFRPFSRGNARSRTIRVLRLKDLAPPQVAAAVVAMRPAKRTRGDAPTLRELSALSGGSRQGLARVLRCLAERGYLARGEELVGVRGRGRGSHGPQACLALAAWRWACAPVSFISFRRRLSSPGRWPVSRHAEA